MVKSWILADRQRSLTDHQVVRLTIPDLLITSCREYPNQASFFQFRRAGWQSYTNDELNAQVSAAALGLLDLGLEKGDRVGLLLNSDVDFLVADLACATANLVTVPIDLSQTIENIIFCLQHSEAHALIVANSSLLNQLSPYLDQVNALKWIVVCDAIKSTHAAVLSKAASSGLSIPASVGLDLDDAKEMSNQTSLDVRPPVGVDVRSWQNVQDSGKQVLSKHPEQCVALQQQRSPQNLATIIYTPDESGTLLGVMLSHQNLTRTALASFAEMTGLQKGARESVVTFLPLTHIFARMMLYGHLYYSHRVYFSTPRRVMKHLQAVRPTILTTVPLLLHRVYRRLKSYGREADTSSRKTFFGADLSCIKRSSHHWAMAIALRRPRNLFEQIEQRLAKPIFYRWRRIFGGRIRYCLSGGAALDPTVAKFFVSIGFPLYQGYGLTQTSSTVTFNHPGRNVPGTVGQVRGGVKCAIAQDGEILVQGNGNLMGYFRASSLTAVDSHGWLRTGDLGHLDAQGNLTILGSKKNLFKLTTGKYVTPIPLEETLTKSSLIRHALVVGEEQKFCAALLFVEPIILQQQARKMGLEHYQMDALLDNACIQALFQVLVDEANCHFPYWSTIKKVKLLSASAYPTSLREYSPATIRNRLVQRFAQEIENLYQDPVVKRQLKSAPSDECQDIPWVACPVKAQSLNTRVS